MPGIATWIGEAGESAFAADEDAGPKRPQVERPIIQRPLCLGIGGEQNLKAAIEAEAIDAIGADPAADAIGRFENGEREADPAQPQGRSKAPPTPLRQ